MATKQIEYLSKNAYAKYLGITEKSVRNAVSLGKIKKGFDVERQKIIKHLADKEFGHLHQTLKARPGISKDKLAVKIDAQNSPNFTTSDSPKIGQKAKNTSDNSPVKKKSEKAVKKSEEYFDDEDGFEFLDESGLTVDELIKSMAITSKMTYAEASRRREVIQLAVDKIKLEEQQGLLVRKVEVEKVLFQFGIQIKKALMSIPNRCSDELVSADNKVDVVNILTNQLTEALTSFANFEDLKLTK